MKMIKNVEQVLEKIYEEIRKNCDVGVVGLSGGADSTLVATLLTQALGKENVYGIHMPYNISDSMTFNFRSKNIAKKLGINDLIIPIGSITNSIIDEIQEELYKDEYSLEKYNGFRTLNQINAGNARSRSRMCVLYGVAHELSYNLQKRVRVVGTGNLSEDYIGYDTKGGDALADFFPIGELFKSEVYQLLDYFISKSILGEEDVDRVPSAGLWDGQSDEGELGYSYNEMEPAIRNFLNEDYDWCEVVEIEGSIEKFVYDRHIQNKHKHEAPMVFKLRNLVDKE
jgi:NAD+ synthase